MGIESIVKKKTANKVKITIQCVHKVAIDGLKYVVNKVETVFELLQKQTKRIGIFFVISKQWEQLIFNIIEKGILKNLTVSWI